MQKQEIYLAGGCFWGVQEYVRRIEGVVTTQVGYINCEKENPSYEDICHQKVKAIEGVKVMFDDEVLSLTKLLNKFYKIIDPTSKDKQGNDMGFQYRSGIYYTKDTQRDTIEESITRLQQEYDEEIVIEIKPLENYYPAEEYHQDYLQKQPNGYCHIPKSVMEASK